VGLIEAAGSYIWWGAVAQHSLGGLLQLGRRLGASPGARWIVYVSNPNGSSRERSLAER